MDNVCHTLAGAALAECGFTQRTRYAAPVLMLAANIPDVDVLYLFGGDLVGLQSRRGWTHGIVALSLWPFVLLGIVLLWDRFVGRRTLTPPQSLNVAVLLAGSAIAVISHPLLDWVNTYGVRFLMPFSERWFYGDAIFIVDLVLLVLFAIGWFASRRRRQRSAPYSARPARVAVVLAVLYVVTMKARSERTKHAAEEALGVTAAGPRELMVAPLPVSMRTRSVLHVTDSGYVLRNVSAGLTRVSVGEVTEFVPTRDQEPLSIAARATDDYRRFMRWSRFPYFVPAPDGDSSVVFIGDARYARGSGNTWAGVRVHLHASTGAK